MAVTSQKMQSDDKLTVGTSAIYKSYIKTLVSNSMAYGTRRFNAAFTRALQ